MRRVRWWPLLILVALLLGAAPSDAWAARSKVDWTTVTVRNGDDAKRVSRRLKRLLRKASKKAKWGNGGKLKLSAHVTQLEWEEREDVVRLSLTVKARIVDGPTARSHIRLGAHPKERRKLERQALRIVADGLVTRLAEIARQRAED